MKTVRCSEIDQMKWLTGPPAKAAAELEAPLPAFHARAFKPEL